MDDPEISAMGSISAALAELDDETRARVVRWAAERYSVALSSRGSGPGGRGPRRHDEGERPEREESDGGDQEYKHFAELFGAAGPKNNDDKALVAAYWIQEVQGQETWQSQTINTELKNLGHPILNITDALSGNIRRNPQRVMQIKKTGNSRQARKTYKVTHSGLVSVRAMIRGSGDPE